MVVTRLVWVIGSIAAAVGSFFVPPVLEADVKSIVLTSETAAEVVAADAPPATNPAPPATNPAPPATTPAAPRSPAEVERSRRCPEFEELFAEYGLVPVDTFSFIAWRETRCDPTKVNAEFGPDGRPTKTLNRDGSYDVGLLQVNSTWKTVTHEVCETPWGQMFALLDLDCNLRVARYLLDNGGLGHWAL